MNTHATLEPLKALKLQGRVRSYEAVLQLPVDQQGEGHRLAAQFTEVEQPSRSHYKTQLCLKDGKLRYAGLPEQLSFGDKRNLSSEKVLDYGQTHFPSYWVKASFMIVSKEEIRPLADCAFTDRTENILMKGNDRLAGGLSTCLNVFLHHLHGSLQYSEKPLRANEAHTTYPYSATRANRGPSILSITNF